MRALSGRVRWAGGCSPVRSGLPSRQIVTSVPAVCGDLDPRRNPPGACGCDRHLGSWRCGDHCWRWQHLGTWPQSSRPDQTCHESPSCRQRLTREGDLESRSRDLKYVRTHVYRYMHIYIYIYGSFAGLHKNFVTANVKA